MRRPSYMATLGTVICLLWGAAVHAEQEPPKEDAPQAAATAAEPAPAQAAPAKPASAEPVASEPAKAEPASSEPAAQEPARLDAGAVADWAQALARIRQKAEGAWLTVGDICEVKHYKQDKLQGFGLVLDLEEIASQKERASREGETTATPAVPLTELLAMLNAPVGEGDVQPTVPEPFRGTDRLTLVAVTATILPEGVQKGDRIDCEVSPLGGRSVQNGYLLLTQLWPPGPRKDAPAALAAGPIVPQSSVRSGPAKVLGGCLAAADISDQFVKDEKITLILDEEHAQFPVAQDIVDLINKEMGVAAKQPLAKAPNRHNVEVTVPAEFADDPVAFVTLVLRLETEIPAPEKGSKGYGTR